MFGRNNKLETRWLADIKFFAGFTEDQLDQASALGEKVLAEDGAVLVDQGRFGDVVYVIVEGKANVLMNGEYVATIGEGSMVGEMAVVEHKPRNATVVAEGEMTLVSFGLSEFRALLDKNPGAKEQVTALLEFRAKANERRTTGGD